MPSKHGYSRTPTYNCWANMIGRCSKQNRPDYKNYGGRGISVCERWKLFVNFLSDMGEKLEGMSLDRIDVDGDYSPENCRWVPVKDQYHNKRDTLWVVLGGEAMSAAIAAKRLAIPYERIRWCVSRYGEDWIAYATSASAGAIQYNNTSGYRGVSFHKASGKFHAKIQVNKKVTSLGYFNTFNEARDARIAAEIGRGMK